MDVNGCSPPNQIIRNDWKNKFYLFSSKLIVKIVSLSGEKKMNIKHFCVFNKLSGCNRWEVIAIA